MKNKIKLLISLLTIVCASCLLAEINNADITGDNLTELLGQDLSESKVQKLFDKLTFNKARSIVDRSYYPNEHLTETDYYICPELPIEIVTENLNGKIAGLNDKPYVKKIRIGYPHDSTYFRLFKSNIDQITNSRNESIEKMKEQFKELDKILPYDLKATMSKHELAQKYNKVKAEAIKFDRYETGYVNFYTGLMSPLPMTVYFYKGNLSGVDIYGDKINK